MQSDNLYFERCFDLASMGGKHVRPNPNVGCVLVYQDRIIGEGYHQKYGESHAEVNAIRSVSSDDVHLLSQCTLYVSLEPCCHEGITPPCTDIILKSKIPTVKIALSDPSEKVNKKGIKILEDYRVDVHVYPPSDRARDTISQFVTNFIHNRPYVQLKFAKSKDNFIGNHTSQVKLTSDLTDIYTHKMRGFTDAILIGTNTAQVDNPSLTIRHCHGDQPQRIVLDRQGKLSRSLTLLSDDLPTIIITETKRKDIPSHKKQIILDFSKDQFLEFLLIELYNRKIYHLMVEGGSKLLRSFIKKGLYDEAVIINTPVFLKEGISAPNINGRLISKLKIQEDEIFVLKPR